MSQANPRPGKLGDEITKARIEKLMAKYAAMGYYAAKEARLAIVNGRKKHRYLDIGLSVGIGTIGAAVGVVVAQCNGCNPADWALAAKVAAQYAAAGVVTDRVFVRGINVGLFKKNGKPVKREMEAQEDIESAFNAMSEPRQFEFLNKFENDDR